VTLLSVNLNKVALLRNTRRIGIPSVVNAARIALGAGAHGITVHPRPDGRHVRSQDVRELAAVLRDRPGAEFNIEGNPFHGLLEFVREVRPAQCALVPVLARTHGRPGAMAGACVVLPMWVKRVLGNTRPEAWTPRVVWERLLFDRDADIAESGRA